MIIYGTSGDREIGSKEFPIICPVCEQGRVCYKAYMNTLHIYYIPFSPASQKKYSVECKHCCSMFPQEILQNIGYHNARNKSEDKFYIKTPWWVYSGLIIFAIISIISGLAKT